eukprot:EST41629.1 Hypothetical protein SS50377_18984 [Spironucleus salmonicida]
MKIEFIILIASISALLGLSVLAIILKLTLKKNKKQPIVLTVATPSKYKIKNGFKVTPASPGVEMHAYPSPNYTECRAD